jgi:carbon-monoxide dehydrogenase medium subunit
MSVKRQFEQYHRPDNVDQALEILAELGNKAQVIAGGTDILPLRPGGYISGNGRHLVDIAHMGLDYIREEADGVHIGAAATINRIGSFPLFAKPSWAALSQAAVCHSTPTLRNRATIGGNLCNASPCSDLAPPLMALDARALVRGPDSERQIPVENFYKGANLCALENNEILVEISIPFYGDQASSSFLKLRRQQTAVDMAVVNTAVLLALEDGCCTTTRIALGSVGPVPFRAEKAESLLLGKKPDKKRVELAASAAAAASSPIDDIRATAAYRKKMAEILVRKALENSLGRYRT